MESRKDVEAFRNENHPAFAGLIRSSPSSVSLAVKPDRSDILVTPELGGHRAARGFSWQSEHDSHVAGQMLPEFLFQFVGSVVGHGVLILSSKTIGGRIELP